jgi:hypothetical protein
MLDSEDYWFDVIQNGYPRLCRCACKNTSFRVKFDYCYRDDGDVRSVSTWSICASCGRTKRQMSADIDYGATAHLVSRPLRYCKNPKILYDLKDLSLYATRDDMVRIAGYLGKEEKCDFVCWLKENGEWVLRRVVLDRIEKAIRNDAYLRIYAMPGPIKIRGPDLEDQRAEDAFWKRHEIIRISSATHMILDSGEALLFYVAFSNEYVEGEEILAKSEGFRELTRRLLDWLGAEFVSWRGPHCFDSASEHSRAFGDRFTARVKGSGQSKKNRRGKQ